MKRQFYFATLLLIGAVSLSLITKSSTTSAPRPVLIVSNVKPWSSKQIQTTHPNILSREFNHQARQPIHSQRERIRSQSPELPVKIKNIRRIESNVQTSPGEKELYQMAKADPATAVQLVSKIDPTQRPNGLMGNLVLRWAKVDLLDAAAWVELKSTGDEKRRLQQQIVYVMSQADPAAAAEFVSSQMPPGRAQNEAVMTVINQWGNQNLAAVASWVLAFPDGPLKKRAVEELEGIEAYQKALTLQ